MLYKALVCGIFLFPSMTAIKGALVDWSGGGRVGHLVYRVESRMSSLYLSLSCLHKEKNPPLFRARSIPGWNASRPTFPPPYSFSSTFHSRQRCLALSFSHRFASSRTRSRTLSHPLVSLVARVHKSFSSLPCRFLLKWRHLWHHTTLFTFHNNLSHLYLWISSKQTSRPELVRPC